jgi:hypothetical protein
MFWFQSLCLETCERPRFYYTPLFACKARKLESELDVKLAAYAKLCSGYEGGFTSKGEAGLATDQVNCD